MRRRSACAWIGLAVALLAGPASADPNDADPRTNPDADTGDLRPAARAILHAAADTPVPLTLDTARRRGLIATPPATTSDMGVATFDAPATIRVWRRGLDGSTSSCSGRVDEIDFATYVKGVLPHEWIRSWEPASLETGAIVIRSYAAWWVNAGGKYDCADLDDTTASQVYRDEWWPETDAAVDATAGIYVVDGSGDLVFAEYSAENGDPTALGVDDSVCAGRPVQGHGRGTCQWGSQRWAQAGKTSDWIATHYYPGSELINVEPSYAATLGAADHQAELTSGDEMVVWVEYTNDGNTTWDPATTLLGTTGPRDRDSAFFKAENWVSSSRPTGVDHATAPGAVGRFTFAMVAPEVTETTTFTESFGLVTSDGLWFGPADDAVTWSITVSPRDPGDDPNSHDPDPTDPNGTHSGGCSAGAAGGGTLLVACAALLALRRRRRGASILSVLVILLVAGAACTPPASDHRPAARVAVGGDSPLVPAFLRAGADTGVPPELLAAMSYVETRFRFVGQYAPAPGTRDDHGVPAVGLLGLAEGGPRDIARGAELAGVDEALVHTDVDANLHAGAALLVAAAPEARTLVEYRPALVAFAGGAPGGDRFADEIYARLAAGFAGQDADGLAITVTARPEVAPPHHGLGTITQGLGYPGANWAPASTSNYQSASRGAADINYVVIHTVQGSYAGCISWFQNPAAEVSSHYVARSSDGEITQMVDDSDIAWHDACFNSQSIGIEHEGYIDDPGTWYTEAMYIESAKLTSWIADSYGIPKDRAHIYGHGDAPDCSDHTDPGPGWDWAHYMDLVSTGGAPMFNADAGASDYPTEMTSGDEAVVWMEFVNGGNTTWDIDQTRVGTAEPQDRESAFFKDGNWLSPDRPSGADHSNYGPGATGRFTWVMKAPDVATSTTFDEAFQLVQEGVTWFGPVVHMTITVHPVGGDPDPDPGDDQPPPGGDDEGGDENMDPGHAGGCSATGGGNGIPLAIGCAMLLACGRRRRRGAR